MGLLIKAQNDWAALSCNASQLLLSIVDQSRSGVVYNFIRVCLSVCMYVCQTITFESLDVGSSYLHIRGVSRECGSGSYMKVKVKVTGVRRVDNAYSRNVKLRDDTKPLPRRVKIPSPLTPLL